MTLLLKQVFAFIKMLNSETGTNQIAAGIACGLILGMAPSFSLQTLFVIGVLFIFRIQIGAATLSAFFFKFIAFVFDPFFHSFGKSLLQNSSLKPLWTSLYNMPLIPFTRFNNSVVMGAGIASLLLFPFVFILSKVMIKKYRTHIVARFQQTKFWKLVKATSLYKWYVKVEELRGA